MVLNVVGNGRIYHYIHAVCNLIVLGMIHVTLFVVMTAGRR